ncbi:MULTISPECIES: HyaD/HybD family hydrogenase maturation endopeptidase [unclassified Hydrogenobaculum]|jgi:hydrogenase maturation protease|uniref:HyaD/HybD family hydrogenase maturation endopeptidase n=1 Tax=unclassified Hydrogenobaculum TaxID=2622382 RepID=UPI0001C52AAD|nr:MULTISPECIES: HyaD/HybD family hydrogenase maturation endopeptidase [unclassified Hydrogenobaculum]AEF18462.1 hydrogenase maturation protease [Hydrogenobaculum sp. 3684]AEG45752.1 hydrogenase maturation protease [Hydrogenobaculum sp. SHO]AGG14394.1 Hydrogenase 2 maturation peptidase [Hydrogenobaculum sp. HO]AGH92698.1 Hydrogenase 2 maturation peptidase [Hydrogenobaculum sp. SN]
MRTILMGIGNILLQDEGVGVHVIKEIEKRYSFEPSIEIIDAGTLGLEIMYMLQDGVDNLLVVDAVMGGKPPGSLYVFRNEEVKKYYLKNKLSAHEVGFSEVLALLDLIGKPVKENLILVGIEPVSFDVSLELHEKTASKMEDLIKTVLQELQNIGIKALEKIPSSS